MNEHISRIIPIVTDVKAGRKTARQYVEAALAKIDETAEYHAVLEAVRDRALQCADEIDRAVKAGEVLGKLAGVPFVVKDNILTYGSKTTAASNMLKDFEAPYQATVIERLEAEGAIVVAKANLDAFAHGSSTENSDFGPTKNPHDPTRVPGGSSGGSAAAVALDIAPFALGSDTGGSIRLPASYCGVVGVKPTYGAVSRYGAVAMASSTDVIGPLTHSAFDAQLVLEVMGGKDERDGTTLDVATRAPMPDLTKLRIGIISQFMGDGVQPAVREKTEAAVEKLKAKGATIVELDMPALELALPAYYIIVPAEVSSNLARYDGIKYGHVTDQASSLDEVYGKSRDEGFGVEAKRRIMMGVYVLSSGYYDAYYRKAQTARTAIINEFAKAFTQVDVLVSPTAPTLPFKFGEKDTQDPVQMYLSDTMTVGVSLAGLPALSVPVGQAENLPVGLHIIGAHAQDAAIMALADQVMEENRA